MTKLNLSVIVSALALIGVLAGFILRYGPLPAAVAKIEGKVEQQADELAMYRQDVRDLKTEQRWQRKNIGNMYKLLKAKL